MRGQYRVMLFFSIAIIHDSTIYRGIILKIVKLVLHNYKRLFLNGIMHIEYTPESKTQVILGQNGSGKSSLLEQLTPLPANLKKDFNEGGYREITINHNSSVYVLSNRFDTGHSFTIDGVEYNHSHKITMQIQLVEEYFNITPNIQQILLGKTIFTTMTPNDRKKWITDMSSIDYSYAIKVYNNLKARRRDIVGGIKLLQDNIVKAKKSVLPKEMIDSLEKDKVGIEEVVDYLFTLLSNDITVGDLDKVITNIERLVKHINNIANPTEYSLEELNDLLNKDAIKIEYASEQLKSKYIELDNLSRVDVSENKDDLSSEIRDIDKQINLILNNSKLPTIDNLELVHDYLDSNYSDIVSLLSPLSEYATAKVTNDQSKIVRDKLARCENEYNRTTKRLYKLEERLATIEAIDKESKDIECPVCGHMWDPEYNSKDHETCASGVATLTKLSKQTKRNIDKHTKELDIICRVKDIITTFIKYFNVNDDTRRLLDYIKHLASSPETLHAELFSIFEKLVSDINYIYPIIELRRRKEDMLLTISKLKDRELLKIDMNVSNKDKIETTISELLESKVKLTDRVQTIKKHILCKESRINSIVKLEDMLHMVYSIKNNMNIAERNTAITIGISRFRSMLLDINNKLSHNTEYESMLSVYQTELNQLNNKEKLLKIALRELSPSEGLIAKSISSFLNYFIQDINNIISNVWGYDMELLSCDLGDDDLDYKFKVMVNNDEVIEDIGKTSSSMQEMINLAFKIIFMKYMNLSDYPLILDEFGHSFDSVHRVTAYESLERNIAQGFSQLYMVSHFESMYGRFSNMDVSILGTTGVDLNTIDKYNTVMDIS